jgi:hypothetical protein
MPDTAPTREELAAAADQLRSAPAPGISPPGEAEVAAGLAARQAAGPAGLTGADVKQLLAGIQALQDRVNTLEQEKAAGAAVPVQETAQALRDLVATHAAHNPGTSHADALRLADDVVDAAKNAADSGDPAHVISIAGKLDRALMKVHPGPGDHHYFAQALGFVRVHLIDAAEALAPRPAQAPAAEVGSGRPPAKVTAGSVTG